MQTVIKDRDDAAAAVLRKIAQFEALGAILPADAHTLRTQVQDSTSGQWPAVEKRLRQLACGWNPYQGLRNDATAKKSASSEPKRSVLKKQDFYDLLQVEDRDKATPEDIKRQFRSLALRLHPDKQQQQYAAQALGKEAIIDKRDGDDDEEASLRDSTKFARLRLAYETLSDPARRAEYDTTLAEQRIKAEGGGVASPERGVRVANQMQLEANTDFASLEWMARVKHKMDVMDRIADWVKMLGINATEIRFETGEPCLGRGCGKIVSMDRDLECYGSPRRRVYVCLLHKYIHACDEVCTSHEADTALDRKVCPIRAHWLVQNWIFDQLQAHAGSVAVPNPVKTEDPQIKEQLYVEETKQDVADIASAADAKSYQAIDQVKQDPEPIQSPQLHPIATGSNLECMLVASEIHLGDTFTRFRVSTVAECRRENCAARFQFLEQGIYACRRHGTPHICTFEQCDTKQLQAGRYICWVSGCMYGWQREEVGTGVRTRQLIYTNTHGESSSIDMEVPTLLPLGKMASYLLTEKSHRSAASFSPPPPAEKTWHAIKRSHEDDDTGYDSDSMSPRRMIKRQKSDKETSPTRARIRRCIATKVQHSETMTFFVYMKLPPAVANLPKVSLELHNSDDEDSDDENGSKKMVPIKDRTSGLLPIRVNAKHTVNYIKYWMEELTDQQISIWDQQIFWGDTLIGEEDNVMPLDEHGIVDGCVLELRLHDDCALLVSAWNNSRAGAAPAGITEYNTVQISKEAEEDLEDHQEELTNVIAVEEEAFERRRLDRKMEKLQHTGVLNHVEVIEYSGSLPRLVGMIPINSRLKQLGHRQSSTTADVQLIKEEERTVTNEVQALKRIADDAKPVK